MRFNIITLGCKVNSCESAAISAAFISAGYQPAAEGETADIYIVNSCAVTGMSVKKARQAVSHCRAENPEGVVVLCGCYPQAYQEEAERDCDADIITGNAEKGALPAMVEEYLEKKSRISCVGALSRVFDESSSAADLDRTRAFIKIEDGCDRFCTYCIIPTARGRVRSRTPQEIARQAQQAAAAGNREIVLTGINIGCYGEDIGYTPADAVLAAQAEGIERVRLGSLEADTLTDKEIERLSACDKLCPHFHLSLQSGSDAVLQRMKRRYTAAEYEQVVEKLRRAFRGCAVTTDIMVGFPGESDEEFEESMAFAERIGFAGIHVFQYSIRRGTVAAMRTNQVTPQVKSARAKAMAVVADRLEKQFLEKQVGTVQTVLIEKSSSEEYSHGFTGSYIPVRIYGENIPRHTPVSVRITGAEGKYCTGTTQL